MPIPDPRTDVELVAALNRGDLSAFDALYTRYKEWVVRLARRHCHNDADALDVLQETFAYLLRKCPGFTLTAAMTTFLFPVVKHLAQAARRKTMRLVSDQDLPAETPATGEPSDDAANRAELEIVLARLPEAQREVLLLRFVDGLALSEIAEALNVPTGTVKSRLHLALAALRDDPKTRAYFDK